MKKPVNKIQNALFVDAYVAAEQAKIVTGEQAISFFAKVIYSSKLFLAPETNFTCILVW